MKPKSPVVAEELHWDEHVSWNSSIHSHRHSLTYSLTHSLVQPLTPSMYTRSLTYTLTHSLTHPPITHHSITYSPNHLPHMCTCPLTQPFSHTKKEKKREHIYRKEEYGTLSVLLFRCFCSVPRNGFRLGSLHVFPSIDAFE